jgi:NAD(P)-dependent dehydrogenase (short-subunit alcohol dehydrogenase family)
MTSGESSAGTLAGRHVLVTGGTRGIGHAIVVAFAQRGSRVSFVGRDEVTVDRLQSELRGVPMDVLGYAADVTDEPAVRRAVAQAEDHFGGVDVLVNNAGLSTVHGPMRDSDMTAWWRDVSVNLLGAAVCASAVLPGMTARARGRIINMVSGAAGRPAPYNTAYACSKAAVVRLTDSLAAEVSEDGVAVFALRPGTIATDMVREFMSAPEVRRWLGAEVDQMAPESPERAVRAVLWLAEGRGDALSGCWVDAADDLDSLARRSAEIRSHDLFQLRRATAP